MEVALLRSNEPKRSFLPSSLHLRMFGNEIDLNPDDSRKTYSAEGPIYPRLVSTTKQENRNEPGTILISTTRWSNSCLNRSRVKMREVISRVSPLNLEFRAKSMMNLD
jgi:hypothetical protein